MAVLPTPTGNPTTNEQLTSASWQNQPLTPATATQTEAIVSGELGSAKAAAFKTWLTSAMQQDPTLTPNEAIAVYLAGSDVATGTGAVASLTGNTATATGQAALAAVSNPLDFLGNIAGFFNALVEKNTWIRVAEVLAGGMVLYLGLKYSFQGTGVHTAAKETHKTAKKALKIAEF